MKQVLAIAGIAIRTAFRSKVVISLPSLLALIVVGLPLTVKGDGTVDGYIRILLTYTLGCTMVVLTLSTLWSGCAAIATDIDDKVIQLTVTKPVSRFRIWLGKWVGLMVINGLLLAACGATTYGLLARGVRSEAIPAKDRERLKTDLLVARRAAHPQKPDVREAARQQLDNALRTSSLPEDISKADALSLYEQSLTQQAFAVPNGTGKGWTIPLPRSLRPGEAITLRFRFRVAQEEDQTIAGYWTVAPSGSKQGVRLAVDTTPGAFHTLRFANATLDGATALDVAFANVDERAVTVVFDAPDGIGILLDEGGFEGNLARAMVVLLARLAFTSALGVTVGCCFSLPVAIFISLFILGVVHFGGTIKSMAAEQNVIPWLTPGTPVASVLNEAVRYLYEAISLLVRPFQSPNPLEYIATGRLVSWSWVAGALAWEAVVYVAILAIIAGWVLNRRELALPAT